MSGDRPKKPAGWYSKEQRAARAAAFADRKAAAAAKREAEEAARPGAQLRAQAGRLAAAAKQRLRDRHVESPVPQYQLRMARLAKASKRERQRFDHLVLGQPRPKPVLERPAGMSKREWKVERARRIAAGGELEPGVEEAVKRREQFDYGRGTPETNAKLDQHHSDCLAQMMARGSLSKEQGAYAEEIANVYRSIESDVAVKVASFEARVDQSGIGAGAVVAERINRVRMHLAYTIWRENLPTPKQAVLDMIVGDRIGYSVAAARYRMHHRKAKRWLIDAIESWPRCVDRAFSVVDGTVFAGVSSGDPVTLPDDWRTPAEPQSLPLVSPPLTLSEGALDQEVGDTPEIPAIDPRFLDEKGHVLPWSDIAAIIREGIGEQNQTDEAA